MDNLTTRLDYLDIKFDNFNARLTKLEQSVNSKFQKFEIASKDKVNCSDLENILEILNRLEHIELEKEDIAVMKDSYGKPLNVLIDGLSGPNDSTWEKAEETQQIVHKFMHDGPQIENPSSMALVDCHRLPQWPVYRNQEKVIRPITIKLSNAKDKRYLFSQLKHLKTYNSARRLPKEKKRF